MIVYTTETGTGSPFWSTGALECTSVLDGGYFVQIISLSLSCYLSSIRRLSLRYENLDLF